MNDDQIRQLVAQSVSDALAAKDQEIAGAIGDALRTYADRPVGEKGAPSLQYGIVEEVFDTYAAVTLDGQTGSVPINMLGGLVVGERVAVLLVPPSGNLAIGMVTPSVIPGGTLTVLADEYLDGSGQGVTVAGAFVALPWVPHSGIPAYPPNAGLLTPDASGGEHAVVIADGYFTFDLSVLQVGTVVDAQVAIQWSLGRPSTGELLDGRNHFLITDAGGNAGQSSAWSSSYACRAGDEVKVRVAMPTGSGTSDYGLVASVKSMTVT